MNYVACIAEGAAENCSGGDLWMDYTMIRYFPFPLWEPSV